MGRRKKSAAQRRVKLVATRVDLDLYKEVEALADPHERTVAQVVRLALREYVANHQHPPVAASVRRSRLHVGD